MKHLFRSLFISVFILSAGLNYAQSATDLLQSLDDLMAKAEDKQAKVQIILTNKAGKKKVKEAVMFEKGREHKLYRYTQPESQAGIATLSLPDGIMWMYMPAFKRVTKISMLSKSQAITGTDFAYEDMNYVPYSSLYNPEIADSKNPDQYVLKLIPKFKESEYASIILYLDKKNTYPLKMEYFNKKGEMFKEATYKYVQKNDFWYAEEVLMKDLKKEHSTQIIMTEILFNQGIHDSVFTVDYLKHFGAKENE